MNCSVKMYFFAGISPGGYINPDFKLIRPVVVSK
jgi:hypothetical protein